MEFPIPPMGWLWTFSDTIHSQKNINAFSVFLRKHSSYELQVKTFLNFRTCTVCTKYVFCHLSRHQYNEILSKDWEAIFKQVNLFSHVFLSSFMLSCSQSFFYLICPNVFIVVRSIFLPFLTHSFQFFCLFHILLFFAL